MKAGVNPRREQKCLSQTLTIILFPFEVVNRCKLNLFKELVEFYCRGMWAVEEIKNKSTRKLKPAVSKNRKKVNNL
jgi:hypothetical protein